MHGVIAAGGSGSRLGPLTIGTNKHLLPVHDKPMIFYAIATLMAASIREIVVVTNPSDVRQFRRVLGDGSQWGVALDFAEQDRARGVADVLLAARKMIPSGPVAFILGDNLFYGPGLGRQLSEIRPSVGGHIFAARVADPRNYGVVTFGAGGVPVEIHEKPASPTSDYAIPGLYFYGEDVWHMLERLRPSARGELEISDLNKALMETGRLTVSILPRGTVWLDTGTVGDLEKASEFVSVLQERQGWMIGCPEEISLLNSWTSKDDLERLAEIYSASPYGDYLRALIAQT